MAASAIIAESPSPLVGEGDHSDARPKRASDDQHRTRLVALAQLWRRGRGWLPVGGSAEPGAEPADARAAYRGPGTGARRQPVRAHAAGAEADRYGTAAL